MGYELGKDAPQYLDGFDGISRAAVDIQSELGNLFGKEVRFPGHVEGYQVELGKGGKGGELAGLESVEIAFRGASAARAEFMVAMGAALVGATHGPGATTRDQTVSFGGISRHGDL